jgi:metal-dependent amidase/aminoacylase/carboxypeptidase family protein
MMKEIGCDLDRFVEIRHTIHQNPETAFEEFNTHSLIKNTLISFGISEENMRVSAITGLIVDI